MDARPPIATILKRGWRRRCPRCGVGPLFRRGIAFHLRCSACDLQFQRNNGDTWMFIIITDRIPTRCARFNPFAGETPVEGVNYVKGPRFGRPTTAATTSNAAAGTSSFQLPRTYRFSVGVRF